MERRASRRRLRPLREASYFVRWDCAKGLRFAKDFGQRRDARRAMASGDWEGVFSRISIADGWPDVYPICAMQESRQHRSFATSPPSHP